MSRVAVSASGPTLDHPIDPRFGRCAYFLFVDSETMEFEAVENTNIGLSGGAGIQSGQLIAERGARTLLTGNCGPNAMQTLNASGIQVITGVTGVIRQALEKFKAGALSSTIQANVESHFGMGGGRGMGVGRGMGPGVGMGGGRGMGGGMGRRRFADTAQPGLRPGPVPSPALSQEQELASLKEQAQSMKQEMSRLMQRIQELEKDKK